MRICVVTPSKSNLEDNENNETLRSLPVDSKMQRTKYQCPKAQDLIFPRMQDCQQQELVLEGNLEEFLQGASAN